MGILNTSSMNVVSIDVKQMSSDSYFYNDRIDDYRNTSTLVLCLVAILLLICCILAEYPIMSYIALAIVSCHLIYQAYNNPYVIIKYIALYFGAIANVIGCFACEFSGSYLPELEVYSTFVGSLPLLVLLNWIFVQSLLFFDCKGRVKKSVNVEATKKSVRWLKYLNVAFLVVVLIQFASVADKPAFMLGYSRFQYSREVISDGGSTLGSWLNFLVIIPILSIQKDKSIIGYASVIIYLLYLLWTGNKFGAFIGIAWVAVIVFYNYFEKMNTSMVRRYLGFATAIICALIFFAVSLQTIVNNNTPSDYFADRTAQQGQLWWRTYSLYGEEMHPDEFTNEIASLTNRKLKISDNIGSNNGIYAIMYLCAPANRVNNKLMYGSRYTEAGYACAFYYFGWIGALIFAIGMAYIMSWLVNVLLESITCNNIITGIISLRMLQISQTVLSMFTFSLYFTPMSIACLLYLFLIKLSNGISKSQTYRSSVGS